jgi:orotidine-5'-phosphate decarboxylase
MNSGGALFGSTHGIIPALDNDSLDGILHTVESCTGIEGVVGFKIGLTIALQLGLSEAVSTLRKITDLPILYDHQKAGADIPDMGEKFCKIAAESGVSGIIIFPLAGPSAVRSFIGSSIKNKITPLVGGDLPIDDYNQAGGGYVIDDALSDIFSRSVDLGARHFIVPGHTPDKVRFHSEQLLQQADNPSIVIPGIGALGGKISDCFSAASGCNAYAVIGRGIYGADDAAEAAKNFSDEALRFL